MKKIFMLLAVAGFFSMTAVSCGEKAAEGDDAAAAHDEAGHGDEGHDDHDGHGH